MEKRKSFSIYPFVALGVCLLLTISCSKDDDNNSSNTVKDIDGNVYNTVTIGNQVWMVENLKTTKYRNGDPIPNKTNAIEWGNLLTGACCDYDNTPSNSSIYGKLYNWYAVNDTRNIAPMGWHVPSDAEWTIMENYLIANGYNYDATTIGNKYAKALASATGWTTHTGTGTIGNTDYPSKRNATGFTALPGGFRIINGTFQPKGSYGIWWSSLESSATVGWIRNLNYDYADVSRSNSPKSWGLSVRCVRD
jgi:uncharacterized protein (TIGR02145 family)